MKKFLSKITVCVTMFESYGSLSGNFI